MSDNRPSNPMHYMGPTDEESLVSRQAFARNHGRLPERVEHRWWLDGYRVALIDKRADTQRWRDDAFENAASIAERYGATDAARDIRAMVRTAHEPSERLQQLEAFKDAILSGCTEELYCGPYPPDLWSTIIGECQPCKGSGVVRDAKDEIIDCAACGSSGAAVPPTEHPDKARLDWLNEQPVHFIELDDFSIIDVKGLDVRAAIDQRRGQLTKEAPRPDPAPPGCEDWWHLKKYGYAPGNYTMKCPHCKVSVWNVDKRALCCKPCATAFYESEQRAATETNGDRS